MAAIHESFKGCQHYDVSSLKVREHLTLLVLNLHPENKSISTPTYVSPGPHGQAGQEEGEEENQSRKR